MPRPIWTVCSALTIAALLNFSCSNHSSADTTTVAPITARVTTAPNAEQSAQSTTIPTGTEPAPVVLPAADQRDEWGDPIGGIPPLPQDKQALIESLDPNADCTTSSPSTVANAPQTGQVVLAIVRVVNGCVLTETAIVPLAELEQRTIAEAAEPDVISAGEATTAFHDTVAVDPDQGEQQWWLDDLNVSALDALTVDTNTLKVRVAVIDSGIDDSNTDLAGLVVGRGPWASAPTGQSSDDPHGTHVAGIIAATAGNGSLGRGVATDVEFLDVNDRGQYVPDLIDWAVDHGADVINMSFCEVGSDGNPPCRDTPSDATIGALAWARFKGVVLVASAGNCGPGNYNANQKARIQCGGVKNRVTYPAAYGSVISVGAYSADGTIASFSTQNAYVDVAAPGSKIRSTVFGATTAVMSGTSQAAPMVAGAAAALLAHRPDINPARVQSGLFSIVRDAGPQGWDSAYGNGKINPSKVATLIDQGTPPPPRPAEPAVPVEPTDANFAWPYQTYFDVPQLGSEPVRGSGCGASAALGDTIPDGTWNGYIPTIGAATLELDVDCVYYGESATPFVQQFIDEHGEEPINGTFYFNVNNTTRTRTVPLSPSFIHRDAEWIDGKCLDPDPGAAVSHDSGVRTVIDSWVVIKDGQAVFALTSCPYG